MINIKKTNKINKSGFTIIEFIVVIALIGILVLLGIPKYLDYIERAKIVNIRNDIRVVEDCVETYLMKENSIENWNNISLVKLNYLSYLSDLYDKRGILSSIENNTFKIIPKDYLKKNTDSRLKGTFIIDNNLKVYYTNRKENEIKEDNGLFEDNIDNNFEANNKKIQILDYKLPNGIYNLNDDIDGYIKVKGIETGSYKIDLGLRHVKTDNILSNEESFELVKDEIKEIPYSYKTQAGNRLGFYDVEIVVQENLNRSIEEICKYKSEKTVYITSNEWEYFYQDDFTEVDKETISKIGTLKPENIEYKYIYDDIKGIDYHSIDINAKANSNITGQIKSKLPMTYGSYECRMKIPDSDSLLNGFFLYGPLNLSSDLDNEIDIEIMKKDNKWQIWTTIYNPIHPDYKYNPSWEPGVIYHNEKDLEFDPTIDFHNYRIDYYEDSINFYIDGIEFDKWIGKYEYSNMNLYAGTFYSFWLANNISDKDLQMNIEWIRRSYK